MRTAVITACATILLAGPCLAQGGDTPEDRTLAALALQQSMGGEAAVLKTLAAMRPSLIKLVTETGHLSLARAAQLVDEVEIPTLGKDVPDMLAARARIYAKHFSAQDLRLMTAFYQSPTGQRVLAEQSTVAAEYLLSLQPFIRDVQAQAAALAKKQATAGTQTP